MKPPSWAIGFVTLERPLAAQRFVRSAREQFPDVAIYVAEQSRTLGAMAEFYAAERVHVVRVPYDAGLSVSRNALVEAMPVDYLALCDDDFKLGPTASFQRAINVLEQDPELSVVGGMLYDYDGVQQRIRNWEMFFDLDARSRRFTVNPIYNYPPVTRQVAGETLYLCDAVLNFAVFRKAMFSAQVRWEESIKINGEHEDFFLNLKQHTGWRVAYLPELAALHWHVPRQADYMQLRIRAEGRSAFMRKWKLSAHLEIGSGCRPLDGTPVSDWFPAAQAAAGGAAASGMLHDQASMPPAGISQRALFVSDSACRQSFPASPELVDGLAAFEPVQHFGRSLAPDDLLFSYQPMVDSVGSLQLWHRSTLAQASSGSAGTAGVVLRWYSARGDVLVWESAAHEIKSDNRYWQPLAIPVPLWPRGVSGLRFEVLSACTKRTPLACGFLFPASRQAQPETGLAPGVLAWSRAPLQSVRSNYDYARKLLPELLAAAPRREAVIDYHAGRHWVTIDSGTFEFLGVSMPHAVGPGLLLAPQRDAVAPLALPLILLQDSSCLLFAGVDKPEDTVYVLTPRLTDRGSVGQGSPELQRAGEPA